MVSIRINIQSDGLPEFRGELLALVRDLRRLERESPFRFEIIGYPAGEKSISVISRPSSTVLPILCALDKMGVVRGR